MRTHILVLLPTLSGFRSAHKLLVEWTTNYGPVYDKLLESGEATKERLARFQLVVPLETIVSATIFDKKVYDQHFAPKKEPR